MMMIGGGGRVGRAAWFEWGLGWVGLDWIRLGIEGAMG